MSLQGNLTDLPIEDLLQILSTQDKTGVLTIYNKTQQAVVYFQHSNLFSAYIYSLVDGQLCVQGETAIYTVLSWSEGSFSFELKPSVAATQNVFAKIDFIILEYDKNFDEKVEKNRYSKLTELCPRLVPNPPVRAQINLEIDEWQVLLQISDNITILEIAQKLRKEVQAVANTVESLEQRGLLVVTNLKDGTLAVPQWNKIASRENYPAMSPNSRANAADYDRVGDGTDATRRYPNTNVNIAIPPVKSKVHRGFISGLMAKIRSL